MTFEVFRFLIAFDRVCNRQAFVASKFNPMLFHTSYDILGKTWFSFMTEKVPGYYRNSELSVLPIFSRNTEIASIWANELLKYEDHTRWIDNDDKQFPLRRYYKPKLSPGKDCLHTEDFPCVWCLPGGQFVNQNNPINRCKMKR